MGFKNASQYFQREIDAALGNLRLTCCVVYIDDICIYSSGTLEDHLEKVAAVIRALRIIGFSGNPTKCAFAQKEVVFLGHRISNGKISPLHDKLQALLQYKRPQSITELRSFLGFASYYRRFIKDFAAIAAPLHALTTQTKGEKGQYTLKREAATKWTEGTWTNQHQTAFETLKGALLTNPVLTLPHPDHKWRLATDASNIALGAVLSQINSQMEEHPVAYFSRKLLPNEAKWDIWELELLAVVWATTICKHYLRSVSFELVTDSKVVASILKKDLPSRRENLIIRLSEYDFTITHRKGDLNRNADFFSRWAAYKTWEDTQQTPCISMHTMQILCMDMSAQTQNTLMNLQTQDITDPSLDQHTHFELTSVRRRLAEEQRQAKTQNHN
jgi:hypothetical protein